MAQDQIAHPRPQVHQNLSANLRLIHMPEPDSISEVLQLVPHCQPHQASLLPYHKQFLLNLPHICQALQAVQLLLPPVDHSVKHHHPLTLHQPATHHQFPQPQVLQHRLVLVPACHQQIQDYQELQSV